MMLDDTRFLKRVAHELLVYLREELRRENGNSNGKRDAENIDPRLLTVPQAARMLGRSERGLWHLIQRNQISGVVRHGRSVRLDVRRLEGWIRGATPRRR